MKNKNVRGILALVLVTALSFGVIAGSRNLAHNIEGNTDNGAAAAEDKVLEELDVAGAENIEKAVKTENGYTVTVKTKGYASDILMNVSFDADAKNVTKVEVLEQGETEGLGAKIAEAEFLGQFDGVAAPVYLPGMSVETNAEEAAGTDTNDKTTVVPEETLTLNDGTYEAKTTEADANGFTEEFTLTVADGKIASAVWDCVDAEGNKKSVLSENGQYVMTEDGPTWKEQAEALAAALVENQSVAALGMNEEGKTDAVSGVSINIMGFTALAEECLKQAAGETETAALADGTYEAKTTEADANGFTEEFTLTVADGKIASAVWDCVDAEGNKKSVLSENGQYVMTEDGPTWKEQAEALAAALVENQSVAALGMNEEGKTDAVSGVSINIMGFTALAEECLKQAAGETETAALADGTYEAKTTEADANGFTEEFTLTVADGKIASAVWDCVDAEGNKKSVLSENGQYVMTEDGPTWKEQAEALAAALVENQSVAALGMNEEGKTDAVSGVSINIMGFTALAEECLKQAAGETEAAALADGTYEAKTTEADANGFTEEFTLTVADGKIASAVWDCVDAEGNKKSVLSENGQYVMTEDGPTWKEQAEALAAALVENQSVAALGMNEEGKTDAVSGVSINIMGFTALAEECLKQAAGETTEVENAEETAEETVEEEVQEAPQNGTLVDGVSGATISSTAAVKGINAAYDFLQSVK